MMAITPERKKLYGALHAAAKKAGLTEDADYRAMLVAQVGKDSAKDMTDGQIRKVLAHLNRGTKDTPADTRRRDDSPTSRKIRALWLSLHHLGTVRNPSETALTAFVRPIAKVDDLRWLSPRDAFRVIEALKSMGERDGVRWAEHKTPQEAIITAQLAKLGEIMGSGTNAYQAVHSEVHGLVSRAYKQDNPSRDLNCLVENLGQRMRDFAAGGTNEPAA